MSAFLLLLTMIIIIVLFVGITRLSRKLTYSFRYKIKIKWLLGGYIVILLVSMMVYEWVIPEDPSRMNISVEDIQKISEKLYNDAIAGKVENINSSYIRKKWDFQYQENKLNIANNMDEYFEGLIVADRKSTNDGKIEAVFYQTPSIIRNKDFSESIKPLNLDLSGNILTLVKSKPIQVTFSKFKKEFTITQFTGEDWTTLSPSGYIGSTLLYLKIPKNLELVDVSGINLQYVGMDNE